MYCKSENVAYPEQVYQHFRELGIGLFNLFRLWSLAMTVSLYLVRLWKILTSVFHQWLLQDLGGFRPNSKNVSQ